MDSERAQIRELEVRAPREQEASEVGSLPDTQEGRDEGREVSSAARGRLFCRIGLHRWPALGTTTWFDDPGRENRYGSAMEYRACARCGKLRDVTSWLDVPDPDIGVPQRVGPLAWARMKEIMAGPRTPLPAPPIPWREDA